MSRLIPLDTEHKIHGDHQNFINEPMEGIKPLQNEDLVYPYKSEKRGVINLSVSGVQTIKTRADGRIVSVGDIAFNNADESVRAIERGQDLRVPYIRLADF